MKAVIGLLLIILRVSHGVETDCDGRQDGAQCYGALGGSVVIKLTDNASEIFSLIKRGEEKLYVRENKIMFNKIENRSLFDLSDGKFKINNLSRSDDGQYTFRLYDSEGVVLKKRTLQLSIQAPVSSVLLVSECLSQGEMRVSCSSEGGDSPQYSWTLDEQTLKDTQLLSGNTESNNITLRQDVLGRLVCSVRNHVSEAWREEKISTCGGETDCDGRHDGAQCYGALGETVVIKLMDRTSETFKMEKKGEEILDLRNNTIILNLIENRSVFTPNDGKFRINSLSKTDGGNYTLSFYNSQGSKLEQRTLQLTIQAPVSSVLLVSECLSQGEMRVSCSSEGGDSPQYSWTLDGQTLTETQLLSGNTESNNITLRQNVSGRLKCSVRNHVSRLATCGFKFTDCSSTGMHLSQRMLVSRNTQCVEPTTASTAVTDPSLLICGLRAAVAILVIIGIFIYFAWKKRKYETDEGIMEDQENSVIMVKV